MSENVESVLAGLVTIRDFAEQVARRPRTITRWLAMGLPAVRVGQTPMIDPARARLWLEQGGAAYKKLRPSQRGRR